MPWPKGRKMTVEHRAKIAKAMEGNLHAYGCVITPDGRARISAANRGKVIPPETRALISAARRGAKASPETREKIGSARRGTHLTTEHKAKISASLIARGDMYTFRALGAPVIGDCSYCGKPARERDHLLSKRRGGTNDPSNLVPACHSCNASKGELTVPEWWKWLTGEDWE